MKKLIILLAFALLQGCYTTKLVTDDFSGLTTLKMENNQLDYNGPAFDFYYDVELKLKLTLGYPTWHFGEYVRIYIDGQLFTLEPFDVKRIVTRGGVNEIMYFKPSRKFLAALYSGKKAKMRVVNDQGMYNAYDFAGVNLKRCREFLQEAGRVFASK